ncbi:MAG: cupin domain-containing protein [Bacteroidia bacterium]
MNISDYINRLNLQPHPEGGYYRETYRSAGSIDVPGFSGKRHASTGIYFLLEENNFSAFHRIKSDELWHFYAGDALEVIELNLKGELKLTELGSDLKSGQQFQYMVPAGTWFGSRVKAGGAFSLVGCTVAPGFDFADFEMAKRDELLKQYPQHKKIVEALTR